MTDRRPASRLTRAYEAAPVAAALTLHATANGHGWLAAPLMLVLLAVVAWRVELAPGRVWVVATGALGAIGGLLLAAVEAPAGPFPPGLMSPLGGALAALAVFEAAARRPTRAWTFAWLTAVLSLHAPESYGLFLALSALVASTLVGALVQMRLARAGLIGLAGAAVFFLYAAIGTWGLASAVRASEGVLVNALLRLVGALERPAGVGIDESMWVGARSSVKQSSRALFEVRGGTPARLRTVVMDSFDGLEWRTSRALLRERPSEPASTPPESYTLTLETFEQLGRFVPVPYGARAVQGPVAEAIGAGLFVTTETEPYVATVVGDLPGNRPPEPAPDESLLELPEALRLGLLPYAVQIGGDGDAMQRARRFEEHFQRRFEYSLTTDLSGDGHPLVVLLKERRPAYCVYFASAMAALLRASGVPARVVGGFVTDEPNRITGDVVVRQRDAHAWVEAWDPDRSRWRAFDPTPPADVVVRGPLGEAGLWVADAASAAWSWVRRELSAIRQDPAGALVRSPLTWMVLAACAGWLLLRRRRASVRREPCAAMLPDDVRLVRWHREFRRVLASAGIDAGPSITDDALVRQVRDGFGEQAAEAAGEFVRAYARARFRGDEPPSDAIDRALRSLRRALRGAPSRRAC